MRPYSPQDRNLLQSFPFEIDCNIQQHIDAMITLTVGSGVLQNTTLIHDTVMLTTISIGFTDMVGISYNIHWKHSTALAPLITI